jgi:hypothetical protein
MERPPEARMSIHATSAGAMLLRGAEGVLGATLLT